MNRILPVYLAILAFVGMSAPVAASDVSYHQESQSYRAYLGVVPVGLLKKSPSLVDHDKQLHGGADQQPATAQHVMVTLFRTSDDSRLLNATVLAEVEPSGLFDGGGVTKPLEKMITSGTVAYGNFFDMPKTGEYAIELKIYEPHVNGYEKVRFKYKRY